MEERANCPISLASIGFPFLMIHRLLHYVIQNSKDGHDSGEDAIASLRLVYYRVQHVCVLGVLIDSIE